LKSTFLKYVDHISLICLEFLSLNSLSLFRVTAAQCTKICPERLNWPSRLANIFEVNISEGALWISKKNLDHFSSSRLEIFLVHLLKEF
jgi:hypothetical protein